MSQALSVVAGACSALVAACLAYTAARRQARDHGRIEHAKTLRNERRASYLSFMEAVERVNHKWLPIRSSFHDYLSGNQESCNIPQLRKMLDSVDVELRKMIPAKARLDLCGPDRIAELAQLSFELSLMKAVHVWRVTLGLEQSSDPEWQDTFELISEGRVATDDEFIHCARAVLEEPPG